LDGGFILETVNGRKLYTSSVKLFAEIERILSQDLLSEITE